MGKKWRLYIVPQYLWNLIKPRDYDMLYLHTTHKQKKRHAFAIFFPVLANLCTLRCLNFSGRIYVFLGFVCILGVMVK